MYLFIKEWKWSHLAETFVDPNLPACLFLSASPRTSDVPRSRIHHTHSCMPLSSFCSWTMALNNDQKEIPTMSFWYIAFPTMGQTDRRTTPKHWQKKVSMKTPISTWMVWNNFSKNKSFAIRRDWKMLQSHDILHSVWADLIYTVFATSSNHLFTKTNALPDIKKSLCEALCVGNVDPPPLISFSRQEI